MSPWLKHRTGFDSPGGVSEPFRWCSNKSTSSSISSQFSWWSSMLFLHNVLNYESKIVIISNSVCYHWIGSQACREGSLWCRKRASAYCPWSSAGALLNTLNRQDYGVKSDFLILVQFSMQLVLQLYLLLTWPRQWNYVVANFTIKFSTKLWLIS